MLGAAAAKGAPKPIGVDAPWTASARLGPGAAAAGEDLTSGTRTTAPMTAVIQALMLKNDR